MAALYKTLNSLRGEFAIFAGRWRKTANIIFFDIRPTPSAHREPPLGEISGIIMELGFFRFLILFIFLGVYMAKKAFSIEFSLIRHTGRS